MQLSQNSIYAKSANVWDDNERFELQVFLFLSKFSLTRLSDFGPNRNGRIISEKKGIWALLDSRPDSPPNFVSFFAK